MNSYRTAILRGGPSQEYEVSMRTGQAVIDALEGTPFEAVDVVITRGGDWLVDGLVKTPENALATIDVVFIALHGTFGEDGTVQRLLDRLSVPYTGSRAFESAVAMNKTLTKSNLQSTGIKTPRHMRVTRDVPDLSRLVSSIEELFGDRYVVKPTKSGSSIGVSMVTGPTKLLYTIQKLLHDHEEVMVEERIFGREATVGVVDNFRGQPVYKLPVIEIIPPEKAEFFDYQNKYNGQTEEICPGRFSKSEKEALETAAQTVHQTLGLSQYSRSDFIVTPDDIYFLEVNTLPGLTAESLLPKSLAAIGCSYRDFLCHLLSEAGSKC